MRLPFRVRLSIPSPLRGKSLDFLLYVSCCLLATPLLSSALAATAQQVLETEVQTQNANAASQQRVDKLSDDSKKALEAYRAALYKTQQLKLYAKELDAQVAAQAQEKAALTRQLGGVGVTQQEIVPLMLRMVDSLEQFIALDLPLLPDERRERVAKLKQAMRDPQVGVGEQFRRVLEAYQIENQYGLKIETWRGELKFSDSVRAVDFVMLGRLALFYLTLDETEAGRWDPAQKKWSGLEAGERTAIRQALRIAREETAPELMTLPVPVPAAAQGGKP